MRGKPHCQNKIALSACGRYSLPRPRRSETLGLNPQLWTGFRPGNITYLRTKAKTERPRFPFIPTLSGTHTGNPGSRTPVPMCRPSPCHPLPRLRASIGQPGTFWEVHCGHTDDPRRVDTEALAWPQKPHRRSGNSPP